tara:strand:- start:9193 stop:9678 length:486 start_codon:yes stop_codon:yes gene_type:complete
MIWVVRLFLFAYFVVYFGIGAWSIIDFGLDAVQDDGGLLFGYEIPRFLPIVGLNVETPIGYSEIAGIYGGINLMVGIFCLLGVISRYMAKKSFFLLAFLTFSIALGRIFLSLIDESVPSIVVNNLFFYFEVTTFFLSIIFLIYLNVSKKKTADDPDIDEVA